ncbi:GDP-fucose protein O-fucosyltransferase [Artemisia annua]|uniref:O-fucosyltransferase family protein n=1 Tax=Artemisia annua TaxID=35608 RepID=A0A2U1MN86_ARTAN|nr:GDP-fucose protein O-fucosyltransferase [Artemisia annua]
MVIVEFNLAKFCSSRLFRLVKFASLCAFTNIPLSNTSVELVHYHVITGFVEDLNVNVVGQQCSYVNHYFRSIWLLQRVASRKLWKKVKPLEDLQPYANPRNKYPDHFINSLRSDVIIVKDLPPKLKENRKRKRCPMFKPQKAASPEYYIKEVLPKLRKGRVIGLVVVDGGCLKPILPHKLAEYQRLRCRVAFQALHFRSEVLALAHQMVKKLRSSGKPYLAYHPGLVRDTLAYQGCAELFQICDLVTISRLLNATLVIPEIQESSNSKGIGSEFKSFSYIYNVDHFINSLRSDVIIVKDLPPKLKENRKRKRCPMFKPQKAASPEYYIKEVLPKLRKGRVIGLVVVDGGCLKPILPHKLAEYQRLRCRVAFQALHFRSEVLALAHQMVKKLRSSGKPYLAYHPGLVRDTLAYQGCAELFQCFQNRTGQASTGNREVGRFEVQPNRFLA